MSNDNPAFISCAMQAHEEGIKATDIKEECACRLGLILAVSESVNHNNS